MGATPSMVLCKLPAAGAGAEGAAVLGGESAGIPIMVFLNPGLPVGVPAGGSRLAVDARGGLLGPLEAGVPET